MFEKKRGTRFLASVMALVMLLSLAPVGALATEGEGQPAENQPVAQSAVDTKDTNGNTPTEPAKDSDSAEATKPEGGLDEGYSADTSNNDNGIMMHWNGPGNGGNNSAPGEPSAQYERLYVTILDGTTFPNEPGFSHKYGYDFVKQSDNGGYSIEAYSQTSYSSNQQVFSDRAGNFIKVDDFNNAGLTTNGNVTGLYNANGIDLTAYTRFTEDDADAIAAAYASYKRFDTNATYKLVPYVLKYEDHGKDAPSTGYHLDCIVVKNETVLVKYDINGATTSNFQLPDNTYVTPESNVTIGSWKNSSGTAVADNSITAQKGEKDVTFVGWSMNPNADADSQDLYKADDSLQNISKETTLYAIWKGKEEEKPTPSTDTVDAKYFVLMPSKGTPNSGADQGPKNYFPNNSDNGGVTDCDAGSGYAGKISASVITEHENANTKAGYFVAAGVESKYLSVPSDLGYFNSNPAYTGAFPDTLGTGFTMQGKQIVWYVIKNEGTTSKPDYHVDGYLAGIPVELRYHENFNFSGTDNNADLVKTVNKNGENNLLSGDTVTIEGSTIITHQCPGWTFAGWTENRDGSGTSYKANDSKVMMDSCELYAKWTNTYTVVTHFMDANGVQTAERTNSNLSGVHGTPLKDMVLSLNKVNPEGISGNYVYVPSETSYSVDKVDKGKVGDATYTEANTVIHQYYYLDETGKIGKDEENKPTDKSDEIPDAWQHKVTFKVVNGKWNDDSSDNIVVYVNAKDKDGKTLDSKLTATQIPAVGNKPNSGYTSSGRWNTTPSANLEITEDTVFTYTYDQKSGGGSGGGGGGSRPTVTIPDDVPTGLNGTDHYAYIIGYGNNDVRPQNNITRAEVATIFFRLLTDETREANMTKSNSYNDVKDGDWFCCAVSTLSKMGIIKGYEDGSFKPNDPISRAEFAAIAARFDPDGDKTPATFADVTSHWAKDEISIAANHGWIKGYEDGSFKPDQKITRAETMTLVNRVLNRLPETKDDLHKDMKTWVDNMDETAWYYLAVQEATNSHYFKNKTSTKFEQWTDLRDTRDWSELEK